MPFTHHGSAELLVLSGTKLVSQSDATGVMVNDTRGGQSVGAWLATLRVHWFGIARVGNPRCVRAPQIPEGHEREAAHRFAVRLVLIKRALCCGVGQPESTVLSVEQLDRGCAGKRSDRRAFVQDHTDNPLMITHLRRPSSL